MTISSVFLLRKEKQGSSYSFYHNKMAGFKLSQYLKRFKAI